MLKNCRKVFREPMNKILERCQIVPIIHVIPCKMIVLIPFNFFALKEVRDMLMREFWAFVPISFKFSSQTTVSIKKFYEQQRQEVRIDLFPPILNIVLS